MKIYILFIMLLILLPTHGAQAYLDPGVGSMLVQLVLAGVAGLGILLKILLSKMGFFNFKNKKDDEEAA